MLSVPWMHPAYYSNQEGEIKIIFVLFDQALKRLLESLFKFGFCCNVFKLIVIQDFQEAGAVIFSLLDLRA